MGLAALAPGQRLLEIEWQQGLAGAPPFADASFERVFASLMLHHLTRAEKQAALAEVARVLVPGGRLHVIDFGPPSGPIDRALTWLIHHGERIADNLEGRIPELMQHAGLADAAELEGVRTAFGRLALFSARRA